MNNTMNAAEVMLDTLSAVMGDYAPRKRRLLLDFKDDHGQDRNMDAIVWHNPKTTDETVVRMLKEQLCSDGGRLSAIRSAGGWYWVLPLLRSGLPGGNNDGAWLSRSGGYEGRYGEVRLSSYQLGGTCKWKINIARCCLPRKETALWNAKKNCAHGMCRLSATGMRGAVLFRRWVLCRSW